MFLQVSVILLTGGCLLLGRGGGLVYGLVGVLALGGYLLGGVWSWGGAWWRPPLGRLLLQVVRILLECILV